MRIVWPGTFMEEGALARNVSSLRKALGDDAEDFHYIETIPNRGHLLALDLQRLMVCSRAACSVRSDPSTASPSQSRIS